MSVQEAGPARPDAASMPFDPLLVLRAAADRIVALPVESFGARVPSCPDWDVTELLSHTGWVVRAWDHVISLPEGERISRDTRMAAGLPKPGSVQHPDGDLLPWFDDGVEHLLGTFRTTPPTKQLTTIFGTHTPSLLALRVVHETAVHRWDAEDALDVPRTGFDPAVATDGIDELLELWVPMRFDYVPFQGTSHTIQLQATDSDDGWVIVVEDDTTRWSRGHDAGSDVTARGSLDDLYLFVWARLATDRLDVRGDGELLVRWQRAAAV